LKTPKGKTENQKEIDKTNLPELRKENQKELE
jgi:hypothetical protein